MIVCQTCGHQNKDDESFCTNCGAYLEWAKSPATPPSGGAAATETQPPATVDGTPSGPAPTPTPGSPAPPVTPPPATSSGLATDAPTERITRPAQPPSGIPARKPPPATPPRQPGPEGVAAAPALADLAGPAASTLGANEIVCPVCATGNDLERTFCKRCGSLLRPAASTQPVPAARPRGRLPVPPAVAAAIAIGGLALVVAAVVLLQPSEPTPSQGPSALTSASVGTSASAPPSTAGGSSQPASGGPSSIAPSVPTGLIAYASNQDDEWGIWAVPASGTGATRIPTEKGMDWDPDLSLDRASIVWSSPGGIRMGTVASGKSFPFTEGGSQDFNPAWAPDGSTIVFSSKRDKRWDIYLQTAIEGASDAAPLTSNKSPDYEPSWSPDSKQLVFTRGEKAAAEIITIDVTTKKETRRTDNGVEDEDPAWSPDGTRIAFARDVDGVSDLFILNLEDDSVEPLATTPKVHEHDPAWSPDSKFIVYQAGGALHIINVDTLEDSALDLPGSNAWASWR